MELNSLDVFDSLSAIGDTLSAIAGTISFLKEDPEVKWALYNDIDCIWFGFADGGKACITIRSIGSADGQLKCSSVQPQLQGGVIPSKAGAIYVNPFYSAYPFVGTDPGAQKVWSTITGELSKVGFKSIVRTVGDQVTLSVLAALSDYGVVHLEGHGLLDESSEVWYALVIRPDGKYDSNFKDEAERTWVIWSFKSDDGTKYTSYLISPQFLESHNNWRESKPLVYGTFCRSFLGTWPQRIIEAGASCYLGWDDRVGYKVASTTAIDLYEYMCDTPKTNSFLTTVACFVLVEDLPKYPHLLLSGNPFTSFQEVVPTGWVVDSNPITLENAGAAFCTASDSLIVSFYNDPFGEMFPIASFSVANISARREGEKITPSQLGLAIDPEFIYNPDAGEYYPVLPCYVVFSELNLRDNGRVSGYLYGHVYELRMPISGDPPVKTVSCTFENVYVDAIPLLSRVGRRALVSARLH